MKSGPTKDIAGTEGPVRDQSALRPSTRCPFKKRRASSSKKARRKTLAFALLKEATVQCGLLLTMALPRDICYAASD